jgi:hypothetical protein
MLLQWTEALYQECDESWARFLQMREMEKEANFFDEVKPYADNIHQLLAKWQQAANEFIATEKPKYVHALQIKNAAEQIDQFVVQSFYRTTSKKRLYQSIQAAKYTCETLLAAFKEVR